MGRVKAFNGEMIDVGDCMGCAKAKNFKSSDINVGEIIRTRNFDVSQDFELPINGFVVIGSIRHIETIAEMTTEEKVDLINLIDIVISSLKKLGVCNQYNVVWEEKDNNHFHVWLMSRHKYLLDAVGTNIIKEVGKVFNYAKDNLRTEGNIKEIYNTIERLKIELSSNQAIQNMMK